MFSLIKSIQKHVNTFLVANMVWMCRCCLHKMFLSTFVIETIAPRAYVCKRFKIIFSVTLSFISLSFTFKLIMIPWSVAIRNSSPFAVGCASHSCITWTSCMHFTCYISHCICMLCSQVYYSVIISYHNYMFVKFYTEIWWLTITAQYVHIFRRKSLLFEMNFIRLLKMKCMNYMNRRYLVKYSMCCCHFSRIDRYRTPLNIENA